MEERERNQGFEKKMGRKYVFIFYFKNEKVDVLCHIRFYVAYCLPSRRSFSEDRLIEKFVKNI